MKIGDVVDEKILRGILAKNILLEGYILPREIIKNLVLNISNLEVKLTLDNEKLRDIICKHTSEMLDNPNKQGIYLTTKFYANLISNLKSKSNELIVKE